MVYPELMEVIYPEPVEGQYIFFSVQMDSITWGAPRILQGDWTNMGMNLVQRNIEVPARRRKETLATVGAQEVYEGTSVSEAGLH